MIRWITHNLGTTSHNLIEENSDIHIVDIRDLVDKKGNNPIYVKTKIEEALKYLQKGNKVAIACDYGISRSNAIAAGVLSVQDGINLNDAVRRVIKETNEKSIKIEVLSAVRKAIGEETSEKKISNKERNILVTGGTGFLGKALCQKLEGKFNFFTPSKRDLDLQKNIVELDLFVKENNIDTIVHLANPKIFTTNESMGTTLVMLKNILDVCVENKLFLIYPSGWEIYSGYKEEISKADESLSPSPGGTYGQTKFLCESLIKIYKQNYDISYTLLRSSPIYGPDSDKPKFIWTFLDKALQNQEIMTHKYSNGFPILDLLYVDDFLNALTASIDFKVQGEINIGSGIGTTTNDVAKMIIEKVGSKSKIRHVEINDYSSNIIMDVHYAKEILKWNPKIGIEQGLEAMVKVKLSRLNRINSKPSDNELNK